MNIFSVVNLAILSSSLSLILCIWNINENNLPLIFLLPLSFLFITIIFHKTYEDLSSSIVFKLFILQACIRYCILAFLTSTNQVYQGYNNSEYLNIAILSMILELFSGFLIFTFFSKKQKISFYNKKQEIIPLKNLPLLTIILSIIFIYIYITGSFNKINTIWSLDNYIEKYITGDDELEVSTLGILLFTPFKILLALLLTSIVYKTNKIKENKKIFFYLITIALSSIFIVGQSRLSIILFILPLLFLISHITNKKQFKKILFFSIILISIILIITTIDKFSRYGNNLTPDSIITANSLNAYFAGPGNIAIGYKAFEKKKEYESILYLINDTLQNIPILSKLTVDEYKLNLKFNEEIYSHKLYADQIVPLSVSGLFHFGIIGFIIYIPFFIVIALYMERLSYKTSFIGYKFIFINLSIIFSMVFMFNVSSFYASSARTFLFLFIPIFIINNIQKTKNKKQELIT